MKTLKQLGISPAPWSADEWEDAVDVRVRDANGEEIAQPFSSYVDACFMSAAPELYEALSDMLSMYPSGMSGNEHAVAVRNAVRNKAYAALAKARGGSEDGMAKELGFKLGITVDAK